MGIESIPQPFPVEEFDPNKFLSTEDWRRTERFSWEFSNECLDKLRAAQCAGRGYFLEVSPEALQELLEQARADGDFVSVANYAMMLHTQNKIQEERDKWHEFHQAKLELDQAKALDDFFDPL